MTAPRPALVALAALSMLAACSWEEVRETASRTARNVCADTSSCTVYEEGEPVKTDGLDPWDTRR